MWKQLWDGRQSPIEPVTSMVYLGGYDMSIKTAYEPTFLGVFDEDNPDELVAVNSGVRTSSELYRIRGLYVLEAHRRKGFASWLINEVVDQARTEKCRGIWALPRQSSYSVFLELGFQKTSEWIEDGVEFGPNCYVIKQLNV
jgi:GNAT superfamily N-acetyltransferase